MILLRIVAENEKLLETVALFLLEENLVVDVNIKRHIERLELVNGKLQSKKIYIITAKTKSILFPVIEKRLKKFCETELPEIYAIPITHMEWAQANQLTYNVQRTTIAGYE